MLSVTVDAHLLAPRGSVVLLLFRRKSIGGALRKYAEAVDRFGCL